VPSGSPRGRMALGKDTQRQSRHTQNVGKIHRTDSETADDGHYVVMRSMAEFANHAQSLRLFVEAVGIEPYCRRYANPMRTLGFPAYRLQRHAVRPLT
jgi:hypothetical protein